MSDLKSKHRTLCKEIETEAFKIIQHVQYLKHYPEANGAIVGVGCSINTITQALSEITNLTNGVSIVK